MRKGVTHKKKHNATHKKKKKVQRSYKKKPNGTHKKNKKIVKITLKKNKTRGKRRTVRKYRGGGRMLDTFRSGVGNRLSGMKKRLGNMKTGMKNRLSGMRKKITPKKVLQREEARKEAREAFYEGLDENSKPESLSIRQRFDRSKKGREHRNKYNQDRKMYDANRKAMEEESKKYADAKLTQEQTKALIRDKLNKSFKTYNMKPQEIIQSVINHANNEAILEKLTNLNYYENNKKYNIVHYDNDDNVSKIYKVLFDEDVNIKKFKDDANREAKAAQVALTEKFKNDAKERERKQAEKYYKPLTDWLNIFCMITKDQYDVIIKGEEKEGEVKESNLLIDTTRVKNKYCENDEAKYKSWKEIIIKFLVPFYTIASGDINSKNSKDIKERMVEGLWRTNVENNMKAILKQKFKDKFFGKQADSNLIRFTVNHGLDYLMNTFIGDENNGYKNIKLKELLTTLPLQIATIISKDKDKDKDKDNVDTTEILEENNSSDDDEDDGVINYLYSSDDEESVDENSSATSVTNDKEQISSPLLSNASSAVKPVTGALQKTMQQFSENSSATSVTNDSFVAVDKKSEEEEEEKNKINNSDMVNMSKDIQRSTTKDEEEKHSENSSATSVTNDSSVSVDKKLIETHHNIVTKMYNNKNIGKNMMIEYYHPIHLYKGNHDGDQTNRSILLKRFRRQVNDIIKKNKDSYDEDLQAFKNMLDYYIDQNNTQVSRNGIKIPPPPVTNTDQVQMIKDISIENNPLNSSQDNQTEEKVSNNETTQSPQSTFQTHAQNNTTPTDQEIVTRMYEHEKLGKVYMKDNYEPIVAITGDTDNDMRKRFELLSDIRADVRIKLKQIDGGDDALETFRNMLSKYIGRNDTSVMRRRDGNQIPPKMHKWEPRGYAIREGF